MVITTKNVDFFYGAFRALSNVTLDFEKNRVTALIGPSGCGKSTLLRLLNRMNDLIFGTRVEGEILFEGRNIYAPDVDPVEIRQRIGMVFQKPNPFPKSIFDEVMALPYHIYVLATAGTRIEQTRPLQYGTALVLIALVLGIDLFAIILRSRVRRKKRW